MNYLVYLDDAEDGTRSCVVRVAALTPIDAAGDALAARDDDLELPENGMESVEDVGGMFQFEYSTRKIVVNARVVPLTSQVEELVPPGKVVYLDDFDCSPVLDLIERFE